MFWKYGIISHGYNNTVFHNHNTPSLARDKPERGSLLDTETHAAPSARKSGKVISNAVSDATARTASTSRQRGAPPNMIFKLVSLRPTPETVDIMRFFFNFGTTKVPKRSEGFHFHRFAHHVFVHFSEHCSDMR